MNPGEIIFKLLLGTLLGGIIGLERQTHGRAAGFRTQLLVCVSCVLLMVISEGYYMQSSQSAFARIDPTRIAAGAMTGVGFLGAGVILKTGATVQGLTTAACIWIVSAIGLAIGAGQYVAGVVGFVIAFVSLWFLRIVETRMPRTVFKYVTLVTDEGGDESTIRKVFEDQGYKIIKMDYEIGLPAKEKTFIFTIAGKRSSPIRQVIETLSVSGAFKRLTIKS
jgi:putative Mg2+ transporter-C (MgtC) family protein